MAEAEGSKGFMDMVKSAKIVATDSTEHGSIVDYKEKELEYRKWKDTYFCINHRENKIVTIDPKDNIRVIVSEYRDDFVHAMRHYEEVSEHEFIGVCGDFTDRFTELVF